MSDRQVTATPAESAYAALVTQRGLLDRASRSAQIAAIIRDNILSGAFRPGERLGEPEICQALGVSRNTLREAFRSLVDQRLAVQELNRGTFVHLPGPDDVREIYTCRRLIEIPALRQVRDVPELSGVERAVRTGEDCAAREDWAGVGAADVAFHRAITALNGSARIDTFMDSIWNELRLAFHVVGDPFAFHSPYLQLNRTLYDTLERGAGGDAVGILGSYLDQAEKQILAAYPRG